MTYLMKSFYVKAIAVVIIVAGFLFIATQRVPPKDNLDTTFDTDNADNFTVESGYLCSDGIGFNLNFEGLDRYYYVDFYNEERKIIDLSPLDSVNGFQSASQDFKIVFDNNDRGTIWENGKITHKDCVLVAG